MPIHTIDLKLFKVERIGNLMEKLNGQHASGADAQAMLVTLQMIQKELLLQNTDVKMKSRNGVSVFMPAQSDMWFSDRETFAAMKPVIPQEKLVFELDPEMTGDTTEAVESSLHEMPTFTRQPGMNGKTVKELNETVAAEKPSLNEVMEAKPKTELASTLQQNSIKDLRKAISINDRYQFINHLFKGDETMYERSIKTINGFNILSEASFWIRRELVVKLTWRDDDVLVQQFNQLVSRRFM